MKSIFKNIIKTVILSAFVAVLFGAKIPSIHNISSENYIINSAFAITLSDDEAFEKQQAELKNDIKKTNAERNKTIGTQGSSGEKDKKTEDMTPEEAIKDAEDYVEEAAKVKTKTKEEEEEKKEIGEISKEEYDAILKSDIKKAKKKESLDMAKELSSLAKKASVIQKLAYPMVFVFTAKIGDFLGTDYIYNGGMGDMLKKLWIISRNLVNIVFVLLLLFMALKYIFRPDEETDLKKDIGIFALVLISVNFSWLGSKLILDASNVATNVVFAIPSGVGKINTKKCEVSPDGKSTKGMCYPSEVHLSLGENEYIYMKSEECKGIKEKYKTWKKLSEEAQNQEIDRSLQKNAKKSKYEITSFYFPSQISTYCWEDLDTSKYNRNTSSLYLTLGVAKINTLVESGTPSSNSTTKLMVNILFAVIIQMAYVLSMGALFIALVIRVAFLWIFVGFSPFLVLLLYLNHKGITQSGELGDGDFKFSLNEFIKWAFIPVQI